MGNRVVITFDKKPTRQSLGIYLHWNGGPESVLAFLEAANEFRVRTDNCYQVARFVQIIGNFFGSTTSLGLGKLAHLDCDNGDNGVLRVSWDGQFSALELFQSKRGKLSPKDWVLLDLKALRAHHYWTCPTPILGQVIAANIAHFPKET